MNRVQMDMKLEVKTEERGIFLPHNTTHSYPFFGGASVCIAGFSIFASLARTSGNKATEKREHTFKVVVVGKIQRCQGETHTIPRPSFLHIRHLPSFCLPQGKCFRVYKFGNNWRWKVRRNRERSIANVWIKPNGSAIVIRFWLLTNANFDEDYMLKTLISFVVCQFS